MKCEEFKRNIASIAEPEGICGEMREHAEACPDCKAYYKSASSAFKAAAPSVMPETPPDILKNVITAIYKKTKQRRITPLGYLSRAAAVIAVVALIAVSLVVGPSRSNAMTAEKIFDMAMPAMGSIKTMIVKLRMLTEPKENFSAINLNGKMVPHTITVIFGDEPVWRVEKEGRTVIYDGNRQYMWTKDAPIGFTGGKNFGFVEWRDKFLHPADIMFMEKHAARQGKLQYEISETEDRIFLTVFAKASGDFTNPYLLNSSIAESDNKREYVFDKMTKLPVSMNVYIKTGNDYVSVMELVDIACDEVVDRAALLSMPRLNEWRDLSLPLTDDAFAGVTAEEAARRIFEGMSKGDFDGIAPALKFYDIGKLRKDYGGMRLVALGKVFRSGKYPGMFVPYEIILPNGQKKRHNMALRNDNPNKAWLLDGGL